MIPAAIVLAAILIAWRLKAMSQALTDALNHLTTSVTNELAAVAEALRNAASGADDTATADAINAQAQRLDDFVGTLTPPAA